MTTEVIKPYTLINEAYFKTYSPIPDNYNIKDIEPYFKVAEEIWIKPLIGVPLYERLLEEVNTNNVSPENSTLLLMLYPYLAFAITYEALPFISYHLSEVGLTVGHSDNSTAAPVSGINLISTRLRSTLETLKSNFKKWLDEHSDSYPLYKPDNCSCVQSSGCDNDYWLLEYFNGGYRNSNWLWQYFWNRNKPNTRLQTFSTPRKPIDLG